MQQLQGRVAVVTGAAGGNGLSMATRLAAAGMKRVLADIAIVALQRAVAPLQAVAVDVADATVPTHPEHLERIAQRMANITALRNPTLPPQRP